MTGSRERMWAGLSPALVWACGIGLGVLLAGCGKSEAPKKTEAAPSQVPPAAKQSVPAVPAAGATTPAPAPAAAEKAPPEVPRDEFHRRIDEVLAIEQEANFSQSLVAARNLARDFKTPEQTAEIAALVQRLTEERQASVEFPFALQCLESKDPKEVKTGRDTLVGAGEAGRIVLRRTFAKGSPAGAGAAAEALGALGDKAAIPFFLERLSQEKGRTPMAVGILRGLKDMVMLLEPAQVAACRKLLEEDPGLERMELIGTLMDVLERRCGGDPKKYGEMAGHPRAYDQLQTRFERAFASGDEKIVDWMCRAGASFLSPMKGLRAVYYEDTSFAKPGLERVDAAILFPETRTLPLGPAKQDNVSARWEGFLDVPADGDYNFNLMADDRAAIYLDEKLVHQAQGQWDAWGTPVKLTKGLHPMKIEFVQTEGDSRVAVHWAGPGIEKTPWLPYRCKTWTGHVMGLSRDIGQLTSTNWVVSRALLARLDQAGNVGRVFLRDAVANKPDEVAARAVETLMRLDDGRMAPVVIERLRKNPSDRLMPALMEGLRQAAPQFHDEDVQWLLCGLRPEAGASGRACAAALCAYLDRACRRDREKFNQAGGDPGAYDNLKAYVEAALQSKDYAVVAWAAQYGAPFVDRISGLYGRYYNGQMFDQLALERKDGPINFWERQMPMPDNRQDDISALWTGFLRVETQGDYTFWLRAENEGIVWVAGREILRSGNRGHEPSATLRLGAGLHEFKAQFREWQGVSAMMVYWSPLGANRDHIPLRSLATPPWTSLLQAAVSAIPNLAAAKPEDQEKARKAVLDAEAAGLCLLRKAARDEPAPVAREALRILVEAHDRRTFPFLLARLQEKPAEKTASWLLAGLSALADTADPAEAPRLLADLKKETAGTMSPSAVALCGILARGCMGDAAEFAKRVQAEDGHTVLQAHVKAALESADAAALGRACMFGHPFTPYLPGLHGVWFEGWDRDRVVREAAGAWIRQDDRQFPHPQGRQDRVSVLWDGFFRVPTNATYGIRAWGDDMVRVVLDYKPVVEAWHWGEQVGNIALTPGVHPIQVFYHQATDRGAYWVDLDSGPNIGRQPLPPSWLWTPPWEAVVDGLLKATKDLGAGDAARAQAAGETIRAAGDVGRAYLRYALRYGTEDAAGAAAELLTAVRDLDAPSLMVRRIRTNPASALNGRLARCLTDMAGRIGDDDCAWLYAAKPASVKISEDEHLALVCAMLEQKYARNKDVFNKMAGSTVAYDVLWKSIEMKLRSSDRARVAWACEHGGAFAPMQPGLLGRYYEGSFFGKLADVRRDGWIERRLDQFNMPGNRRENFSVAWSGYLEIGRGGVHQFSMRGDDGFALWIDDALVVDGWLNAVGQERGGAATLSEGYHKFEVRYCQLGGDGHVGVWFNGPSGNGGMGENVIRYHPTAAMLAALEAEAKKLDSDDGGQINQARAACQWWGETGRIVLRNVVRHGSGKAAERAAGTLVEFSDPLAAEAIGERLGRESAAAVRKALEPHFANAVDRVNEDGLARLVRDVVTDGTFELRLVVNFLDTVAARRCGNDRAKFDTLSKTPNASSRLADYVAAARRSTYPEASRWASEYRGLFAPK